MSNQDSFIDEVTEEVRRDKLYALYKKYGWIAALAVVVLAALYALDSVQIWHLYLVMFIRAVGGAFHWPAMQASTSLMVPK
mgnify:CR=1 FL=1